MNIEEFTQATLETVTERQSGRGFCVGRVPTANPYTESVPDHDGSYDCRKAAAEFAV